MVLHFLLIISHRRRMNPHVVGRGEIWEQNLSPKKMLEPEECPPKISISQIWILMNLGIY